MSVLSRPRPTCDPELALALAASRPVALRIREHEERGRRQLLVLLTVPAVSLVAYDALLLVLGLHG